MRQLLNKNGRLVNTIIGGFVCLAALIIIVFAYRNSQISNIYVIAAAFMVGLSVAAGAFLFRAQYDQKVNVIILGCSVLVSLYVAEFYLVLTHYGEKNMFNEKQSWVTTGDTRTALEVLMEVRATEDIVPPLGSTAMLLFGRSIMPNIKNFLSGISNIKTLLCNESGYWVTYDSDEHGFNNPKDLYVPENVDIAIIGDSFVHGHCVRDSEHVVGLIRAQYPKTLNLGWSGSASLLQLAIFKEYASPLYPKIVVWMYFENDLGDILAEASTLPALVNYLKPEYSQNLLRESRKDYEQRLRQQTEAIVSYATSVKIVSHDALGPRRLRLLLRRFIDNFKQKDKPEESKNYWNPERAYPQFRNIMEEVHASVKGWGGELIFVYLPVRYRIDGVNPFPHFCTDCHGQIIRIVESLKIPVIDMVPEFVNHPDPESLFIDVRGPKHYTSEGYELLAKRVLTAIIEHMGNQYPTQTVPSPSTVPLK